jgi:hypothetical protein
MVPCAAPASRSNLLDAAAPVGDSANFQSIAPPRPLSFHRKERKIPPAADPIIFDLLLDATSADSDHVSFFQIMFHLYMYLPRLEMIFLYGLINILMTIVYEKFDLAWHDVLC